jgi:2,4-dienoyl-CoA reductase-like NADH-dependent reductase (Old Yellow Enzyme family)
VTYRCLSRNGYNYEVLWLDPGDTTERVIANGDTNLSPFLRYYIWYRFRKARHALIAPAQFTLGNVGISEVTEEDLKRPEMYGLRQPAKEITTEEIQEFIEGAVKDAKFYQSVGFDMINIYASYRASIVAHSLSPVLNRRTDQLRGKP